MVADEHTKHFNDWLCRAQNNVDKNIQGPERKLLKEALDSDWLYRGGYPYEYLMKFVQMCVKRFEELPDDLSLKAVELVRVLE